MQPPKQCSFFVSVEAGDLSDGDAVIAVAAHIPPGNRNFLNTLRQKHRTKVRISLVSLLIPVVASGLDNFKTKMDAGRTPQGPANPLEKANFCSAFFFTWAFGIFRSGMKKDLESEDLFVPLKEHKSATLGDKFERLWTKERARKNPSLIRVVVKFFVGRFMFYGIFEAVMELVFRAPPQGPQLRTATKKAETFENEAVSNRNRIQRKLTLSVFNSIFRVAQPLFLGQLLRYFESSSEVTKNSAYLYAGGVIVCSASFTFVRQQFILGVGHLGMKIRVGVCSLIYRKSLRLSQSSLGHTTVGQIVNLLSNDVGRFNWCLLHLHYLWIGPVQTVLVAYFMWVTVGLPAVFGVAAMLLFIPLQGFLGNKTAALRLKAALKTDERIRLMNEVVSSVRVIKMYAWEIPFSKLVSEARRKEMKELRATSYVRAIIFSFEMLTTRLTLLITILAYVFMGNYVTAEKKFLQYEEIRKSSSVPNVAGAAVPQPHARYNIDETSFEEGVVSDENVKGDVTISHLTARWSTDTTENTLTDVNLRAGPGELLAIIGPVGAGKETVGHHWTSRCRKGESLTVSILVSLPPGRLLAIIGPVGAGKVESLTVSILVSLAPGRLLATIGPVGAGKSSIVQAILGELPATSGSVTVKGKLSYASQEPWLFAGTVRSNITFGEPYLEDRYKEVILVCALERDLELLPHGDMTVVGDRGVSLSGGQRARINLARTVYRCADVYILDDPLSAVDTHVGKHLFEKCISGFLRDKSCILITHQLQYLEHVHHIIIINEGRIEAEGAFSKLQESGVDFAQLLGHNEVDPETSEFEDGHITENNTSAEILDQTTLGSSVAVALDDGTALLGTKHGYGTFTPTPDKARELRTRGKVDSQVYLSYLRNGGNCFMVFLMFLTNAMTQSLASSGDYWLSYWTEIESARNKTSPEPATPFSPADGLLTRDTCSEIYAGLTLATLAVILTRSFVFFSVCMRASTNLHNAMFSGVIRSVISFFTVNPSGQILNRFSKDMGQIDEQLPLILLDCLQIGFNLVGVIVLVVIVNYWILLPALVMFVTFYLLRRIYVSTSRNLQRLEGITRSPVFSHLNASLQGLTTIRAFEAQEILKQEFDTHQDLHSSAFYLSMVSGRAFGMWMDIVCLLFLACVTLSFLVLETDVYDGDVGLAITQSIGLVGILQWGICQSVEIESQMTSVERVLEFSRLPSEPPLQSEPGKSPPEDWPSQGSIIFNKVYLRYNATETDVLKDLNFNILPSEKVGIVGRTGAGKSSLISALFRTVDIKGNILIDGVNICDIGLHDLRSHISIIPQEPVLFSGTIKQNLDPFDEFAEDVLRKTLDEVGFVFYH
uniref:Multidrug resistance-associated protein lethal(2)03659 n=1 Tax=Timema monikensis TaxID=170555 RepID=A0A7R9HNR4_9NEOP|nr:unnamed protein product [Timema monikensis]